MLLFKLGGCFDYVVFLIFLLPFLLQNMDWHFGFLVCVFVADWRPHSVSWICLCHCSLCKHGKAWVCFAISELHLKHFSKFNVGVIGMIHPRIHPVYFARNAVRWCPAAGLSKAYQWLMISLGGFPPMSSFCPWTKNVYENSSMPGTPPQTLHHLFMQEILSYVCILGYRGHVPELWWSFLR